MQTPKEDIELVAVAIMATENLPRSAAIAGAQRYALDEALDLESRAEFYAEREMWTVADKLRALAREYRDASVSIS